MAQSNFYIVDVFAQGKYSGNQLAVITNATSMSDSQMQALAQEMNYSETTFILSEEINNGGYDVRIFTPKQELPFAGHPTLGTAYVLQELVLGSSEPSINLNLQVGQIPVIKKEEGVEGTFWWMRQNVPTFHQIFIKEDLASILSLEIDAIDTRFPIQEVSTGVPFIIVPLKSQAALKQIKVNREKYFELVDNSLAKSIFVFCPETNNPENDLSARCFADYLGIPEDPATGSANGCLAGYLAQYNYFNQQPIRVRVEQGYEINRPSLILLEASKGKEIEVKVGGQVVLVAQGQLVD